MPRKTHQKKDVAQVEAFRREAAHRLSTLVEAPQRRVRLWVADEHRYGLLLLPAYSPELNPVETLGGLVKNAIANKIFGCLDSLQAAILKELEPLRREAERVRSLLANHSILASANNSAPF